MLAQMIVGSAEWEDPFTDAELRDELLTLLGAGHETTTAGLAWALQWILGLPEVRASIEEELDRVVGTDPIELEHLDRLPLLDAAIQESLRLHPPILMVLRLLTEDVRIDGYDLPAGTYVCPSPYLAHRDPENFPEPDRFRANRFLESKPGPFRYFPFGGGTRTCIGLSFALFEMKVMLATIVGRARPDLAASPTHAACRRGIIVAPRHETPIVVSRRA